MIDAVADDLPEGFLDDPDLEDGDLDPDRLAECGYWRCGELFERRSATHVFCRKACRSRQRKWERAQQRRAAKGRGR